MKKYYTTSFLVILISFSAFAQKNAFKIHLAPLVWGEARVGYERAIVPGISLQANFGLIYDDIPSYIYDIDNVEHYHNSYTIEHSFSGFTSSLDLKLHPFLKSLKGFYIAPYLKYHNYDFTLPVSYNYNIDPADFTQLTPEQQLVANQINDGTYDLEVTGILDGSLTQFGGGVSIGWQFIIGKVVVIDINPIGLGLEYEFVDANLTTDIDVIDYGEWLPYVENEISDIPYFGDKIDVTAEGNKINMKSTFMLPTYRASISIGFAF